jgi:hypothetical protein
MKQRKFKVDDWVYYDFLPDLNGPGQYRKRAIVLSVCAQDDYYDYEIYIEGKGEYKKTREEYLFHIEH